jgi:histidine triad (HIT) family protein
VPVARENAMPDTIFSKIIAGEVPCQKVYEDDHVLAFLDINPLSPGHTLVIPKRPVARLEELPAEEAAAIARVLGGIAQRVLAATGAPGYNVLQNNGKVSGQDVEHVHFHIIPRAAGDGLGYRWKPKSVSTEELQALAEKINAAG